MIHLDTSFIVDLLREARRGGSGAATSKLESLADDELGVSLFVLCELEAGVAGSAKPEEERRRVAAIAAALATVLPAASLANRYGQLLVELQRKGETIGAMDLLIAATALEDEATLVTRNRRHFERVPGLEVVSY